MQNYYLDPNPQADGHRRVHRQGCQRFPLIESPIYLGMFIAAGPAIAIARRRYFKQSTGCPYCLPTMRLPCSERER